MKRQRQIPRNKKADLISVELPVEVAKKRKEAKSRKDKELRDELNKESPNTVRKDKKQY